MATGLKHVHIEPARIVLLGLGGVGQMHLDAYAESTATRVVGVAEPDPARRALAAAKGIAVFDSHQDLFAAVQADIACVLTPVATHEQVVMDCAAAGVHILCEKPLALNIKSGRRMAAAAAVAGVQLAYGASYRYLPALQTARDIILAGAIGEVSVMRETLVGGAGPASRRPIGPAHYPDGGLGGGPLGLVDHGIHLIDSFRWLTGAEVAGAWGHVNRAGACAAPEWLAMHLSNGALGLLLYEDGTWPTELPAEGLFSWGAGWDINGRVPGGRWNAQPGTIHVHGSTGALRIAHYANQLWHFDANGVRQVPLPDTPAPAHFRLQLEDFARAIAEGRPHSATAEDGIAAIAVLEGLHCS